MRWRTGRIFQYSKEPTSVRLRMFLMQALVHKSMSDMEGILVGKSGIFGLAGRVEQRFAMLNKSLSLS